MIGRELYPLLRAAGFSSIHVSPRMVYVDSGKPDLVEGFTKNTFFHSHTIFTGPQKSYL